MHLHAEPSRDLQIDTTSVQTSPRAPLYRLRCAKTAVNHVLNDGQLILRSDTVTRRSATDRRRKLEPKTKRVLKLKVDAPYKDAFDFGAYQDLPEQVAAATV
ncbi:hypothetical protein S40285_09871 [Stachybotrys chlorohalonatus IBT 40285]|uniref:Uncharacterized protein n=1 Tax=Stachybotrys chlorohalonatus (strain IBT 40285) TaxID=1283841 RepID=A0A084QJT8_STAC4|nr:hypothetical protein S40285_09871 [Stachybotrys chlorohalonata IBT 40285]